MHTVILSDVDGDAAQATQLEVAVQNAPFGDPAGDGVGTITMWSSPYPGDDFFHFPHRLHPIVPTRDARVLITARDEAGEVLATGSAPLLGPGEPLEEEGCGFAEIHLTSIELD